MKLLSFRVVFFIQKVLLNISISICKLFAPKQKEGVIVGTEEIASMLYSLGSAITNSRTVNFFINPFYDKEYDYNLGQYRFFRIFRLFLSPILLGYLTTNYKTFIYISANGYLLGSLDGRAYEFFGGR